MMALFIKLKMAQNKIFVKMEKTSEVEGMGRHAREMGYGRGGTTSQYP